MNQLCQLLQSYHRKEFGLPDKCASDVGEQMLLAFYAWYDPNG